MKPITTKIKKIGNSKGVIIPKKMLQEQELSEDIILTPVEGGVLISSVKEYSMDDLITLEKQKLDENNYLKMAENEIHTLNERELKSYAKETDEFNDFDVID
ncbi:hypothetical protein MY04_1537 [Flammeovirga sp. MY04]|uniref:AbrB/MazE/SpoVT family DNA-binding domain-containing protein n=1 Tax=Flammeovirga sp. MY04 TaxID=1191459 RepID=UPI0008060ED4|nr:hypothetical protein [Flammeovirga sp. MY04]ANQ48913.1 hypothetical protein MY04_1537 [Flammeovirga sp. MY04]